MNFNFEISRLNVDCKNNVNKVDDLIAFLEQSDLGQQ